MPDPPPVTAATFPSKRIGQPARRRLWSPPGGLHFVVADMRSPESRIHTVRHRFLNLPQFDFHSKQSSREAKAEAEAEGGAGARCMAARRCTAYALGIRLAL
jgi:hypothetical protein